ncbi:MAG TPA: PIN domain-containing protein [Gemmatimonadales bacterium]|nr:PIN domain-containing protein [Gemmatimonadales bacterium]
MAAELFVDTSGWFPLVVRHDSAHRAVSQALRRRVQDGARIVTSNLVIAETHALLLRRVGRPAALAFARTVVEPPNVVVWSTAPLEASARDWLDRFDDQDFSLTDAVSFVIMAERRIGEAVALDLHFRVAGFTTLPR